MDGMTGAGSREYAENSIKTVLNESNEAFTHMFDAAQKLIDTLASNWFSSKAVDFGKSYAMELFNVINNSQAKISDLCLKMQDAFNIQAIANGVPPLSIDFNNTYRFGISNFVEINGGFTGMNKTVVKNALSEFNNLMNTSSGSGASFNNGYINDLGKLNNPYFIFYDPNQEQQGALSNLIREITASINEEIKKITAEINTQIEQEEEMINKSAKEAAETMDRARWNWKNQ